MQIFTLASLFIAVSTQTIGVLAGGSPVQDVKARATSSIVPVQTPSQLPVPGTQTSHGCYSNGGNLTTVKVENLSSGVCIPACKGKGYWVAGLHGDSCLCGYAYPPLDDYVTDLSKCNYPCPSYPLEACGGLGNGNGPSYYTIFNTGINIEVSDYEPPKSSSSSSSSASSATSSSASSATTAPATSATSSGSAGATNDPDNNGDKGKSKSSTNVGAIAAGVVVGVVVVIAAIGGAFFFLRRKRNAEIEEEHRRNAAVNAFISGSKPPSSHGSISMTDSRLDPVLAHRRLSDGSIADNQDYSRKILRVTNA